MAKKLTDIQIRGRGALTGTIMAALWQRGAAAAGKPTIAGPNSEMEVKCGACTGTRMVLSYSVARRMLGCWCADCATLTAAFLIDAGEPVVDAGEIQ